MSSAASGGARSRAASPGAKKAPAPPPKAPPPKAAPPVAETKKTAEELAAEAKEAEVGIFGLHPEVERGVIWGPLGVFVAVLLAAGPFKETFGWFILHVLETWVLFSAPFEKMITEHTSLCVALAAMTSLAPLLIVVVVHVVRAASEVEQNASSWQYAALVILFLTTMASFFYTGQFQAAFAQWGIVTAPLEKVLADNADTIIASAAALVLAPIALAFVVFVLRCMFGTRVTVELEATEGEKKNA